MYKVVKRDVVDAPEITHDDIMAMKDAADFLGIAVSHVSSLMHSGKLTTVIDENSTTAFSQPRRLVLRAEVLKLKEDREGKEMPVQVAMAGASA